MLEYAYKTRKYSHGDFDSIFQERKRNPELSQALHYMKEMNII